MELTAQEIMSKIAAAGASGDIGEVVRLGNLLKKFQADIQKAEADKLQKEAEALAGVRMETSLSIYAAVIKIKGIHQVLRDCKATGFTFRLDGVDKDNSPLEYKNVLLTVPVIKERKAGTGSGGGTGETVAKITGMSRKDLLEKYATDEEKAAIAKAKADAEVRGGNPNSSGWSAEKPVVKRILKDNPSLIKK